jgi:hypothetical protein
MLNRGRTTTDCPLRSTVEATAVASHKDQRPLGLDFSHVDTEAPATCTHW